MDRLFIFLTFLIGTQLTGPAVLAASNSDAEFTVDVSAFKQRAQTRLRGLNYGSAQLEFQEVYDVVKPSSDPHRPRAAVVRDASRMIYLTDLAVSFDGKPWQVGFAQDNDGQAKPVFIDSSRSPLVISDGMGVIVMLNDGFDPQAVNELLGSLQQSFPDLKVTWPKNSRMLTMSDGDVAETFALVQELGTESRLIRHVEGTIRFTQADYAPFRGDDVAVPESEGKFNLKLLYSSQVTEGFFKVLSPTVIPSEWK